MCCTRMWCSPISFSILNFLFRFEAKQSKLLICFVHFRFISRIFASKRNKLTPYSYIYTVRITELSTPQSSCIPSSIHTQPPIIILCREVWAEVSFVKRMKALPPAYLAKLIFSHGEEGYFTVYPLLGDDVAKQLVTFTFLQA